MHFYDKLIFICNSQKIKLTPLLLSLNISKGNIAKWKDGTIPTGETLIKLADYFDCSVDYLLGRSSKRHSDNLSSGEELLLEDYRELSPKGQQYLIQQMEIAKTMYKEESHIRLVAEEKISGEPKIIKKPKHT